MLSRTTYGVQTDLKRDDSFVASRELQEALAKYGSSLTHPANKSLFQRGESARGLFLLQSGSVKLSVPGALDRSVGPGALLGVPGTLSRGVYSLTAELLEESQVLFVPTERVSQLLAEHPEIGFHIVQILSREVQTIRQRITELEGKDLLP